MSTARPAHLEPDLPGDRGFAHMPALNGTYGGTVEVYESSAPSGPHVWLRVDGGQGIELGEGRVLHLTAANAWRLSEQLQELVRNHYQGDSRAS